MKDEIQVEDDNIEITVSRNSSKEEIDLFLEKNLKLSKNIIDELGLDADGLFLLSEADIEDFSENMSKEEKENIKKFIHKKEEMRKQEITNETNKEDIIIFLKSKGQDINNLP